MTDPTPDILELGLALSATDAEHARVEDLSIENKNLRPGVNAYLDMLAFRGAALRDLISTLPAKTLADAAVHSGAVEAAGRGVVA